MKVLQALLISLLPPPRFPGLASLTVGQGTKSPALLVYLIEGKGLAENKRRIQSDDKTVAATLAKLETDAKDNHANTQLLTYYCARLNQRSI